MSTTILFVAASPSEGGQVEAAFGRAGYVVVPCDSFAGGRRALHEKNHAVAIIDSALPDGAGIDLLVSAMGAPAVLLTDQVDVPDRLTFLRAGAADCVGKPYDPLHLVARVISVLNRQKGQPPVAAPGFARRLLVVDDSATYAHALGDELRRDGHDVAIALTAHDALAYVVVQELDLAVVDAFLPDMNGVDLAGRLRGSAGIRRTPVLLLTGREKSAVRGRAREVDMTDLIVKSRDLESVRMQVRRMLASEEFSAPSARRSVPPPPSRRDPVMMGDTPMPPVGMGDPPTPASHRSVPPPPSRRDPAPASHRSVPPPPSRRDSAPASHRSVPPPSRRDGGPASQRNGPPSSRHEGSPSSHRTVPPPSYPDPALLDPGPPSHRIVPPSFREGPPSSHRPAPESALMDEVATASGLSRIAGRPALERACRRAGVNPLRLTPETLAKALPGIEQVLRAFLSPEVADARLAQITRLTRP